MNIHQILLGAIVGGASAAAFYSRAREEEKLTANITGDAKEADTNLKD